MSRLPKLDVVSLDLSSKNYMTWTSDVRTHQRSIGLFNTKDASEMTSYNSKAAKVMVFLHYHLHDSLKNEYITREEHVDLWQSLKIVLIIKKFNFAKS